MNARMIKRIETNVERGAAALFGGAVGYAAYVALTGVSARPVYAAASAALAYVMSALVMKAAAARSAEFPVSIFDVRDLVDLEPGEMLLTRQLRDELVLTEKDRFVAELLLTDADRLLGEPAPPEEPLVLDDILAAVGTDSRVVRIFDRKAMPTPGQLSSSINRHLERGGNVAPPDASQALSEALAELRRSLR